MRKLAPARVSYRDDFLILYQVYIMTESFHISLFEGTLHVDKIHVWFKIANITHALLIPVYQQTDFTPKWVVVSHLHDTAMRFCSGVKFSPQYKNRGELTHSQNHRPPKPQSGSKWKTYQLSAMILHSQFNIAFQFRRQGQFCRLRQRLSFISKCLN